MRALRAIVVLVLVASLVAFFNHRGGQAAPSNEGRSKGPTTAPPGAATTIYSATPEPLYPTDCTSGMLVDHGFNTADAGRVVSRLDGGFHACYRLGVMPPGSYRLGLQGASLNYSISANTPAGATMSLSPDEAEPGTTVTVTGYVPGGPPPKGAGVDSVEVCWAGCLTGLSEYEHVQWLTDQPGHFRTQFLVPPVAWLGAQGVHPVEPGNYDVQIPCIPYDFDKPGHCTGAAMETMFHLRAPPPSQCATGQPCGSVTITPGSAQPGGVIELSGSVPLTQLIGDPFGYDVVLLPMTDSFPVGRPDFRIFTVAETTLQVTASPSWTTLNLTTPVRTQPGGATFGTDPRDPRRVAYCDNAGLRYSADGGVTWELIPTGVVATAAQPGYRLLGTTCGSVVLDPEYPNSFYATFPVSKDNLGYLAAFVTSDRGRTWRLLPPPAGHQIEAFAGLAQQSHGAAAMFIDTPSDPLPPPTITVAGTTDGGRQWRTTNLQCPAAGACVELTATAQTNCAKFPQNQLIEYSGDNGKSWKTPAWPSEANACHPTAIAITGSNDVLALGVDGYRLLSSSDSGRTWANVSVPDDGAEIGTILPDGSMLDNNNRLLLPGATAWCPLPATLADVPGVVQVIGPNIWWVASSDSGPGPARHLPVSILACAAPTAHPDSAFRSEVP